MKGTCMQTNNTSKRQEVVNYIVSLKLTTEQMKILKAVDMLIHLYTEDSRKQMDRRFEELEASLRKYFEQMTVEHLNSVNDVLNKFMGEWYLKNMIPKELNESMKNLTERIKYVKGL